MCDCFDMACQDSTNALHLNIKVNSENLLPISQKYNTGTLRVPADPSWPKIPQRKLLTDTGDVIDVNPCVVTLTSTPRRSRTIVRTGQAQLAKKAARDEQNVSPHDSNTLSTSPQKRQPGSSDPRFKRVAIVKSQVASGDLLEQHHDNLKETCHSPFFIPQCSSTYNQHIENGVAEKDITIKQISDGDTTEIIYKDTMYQADAENAKPVILSLHECKVEKPCATEDTQKDSTEEIRERSSAANVTKEFEEKDCLRCITRYSCETQSKIITQNPRCGSHCYQHVDTDLNANVPEKLKSIEKEMNPKKTAIEGNVHYTNLPYPHGHSFSCNLMQQSKCEVSSKQNTNITTDVILNNIMKEQMPELCKKTDEFSLDIHLKDKKSNLILNPEQTFCLPKACNSSNDVESFEPQKSIVAQETVEKRTIQSEQSLSNMKSQHMTHVQTSDPFIMMKHKGFLKNLPRKTKSYLQKKSCYTKADSDCTLMIPTRHHIKRKYSQQCIRKIVERRREKMYRQLNLRHLTLKSKKSNNMYVNYPLPSTRSESLEQSECKLNQNNLSDKFNTLPLVNTRKNNIHVSPSMTIIEDSIDKPTSIPLRTQQLLNKSYLEYYNKVRHKVDNTGSTHHKHFSPGNKRGKDDQSNNMVYKDQIELSQPEIQTLKQCSALSTMINRTLDTNLQDLSEPLPTKQLYINSTIKSSSNPTAGTHSEIIKRVIPKIPKDLYDDSNLSSQFINKIKYKKKKDNDNGLTKFKTIVFFSVIMYATIVFLPMIYDYVFYDDYDSYQNMGYLEFAVEYVVASFKEAFGDIFEIFNNIFLRPFLVIFSVPVESVTAMFKLTMSSL